MELSKYQTKYTQERNKDIFELYKTGRYSTRKIGEMYEMSHTTIWGIIKVEESKERREKQGS